MGEKFGFKLSYPGKTEKICWNGEKSFVFLVKFEC